jgi:hypothetical protein
MSERRYTPRPRPLVLSFLASLAAVSGRPREAEGYLMELLAFMAFSNENTLSEWS